MIRSLLSAVCLVLASTSLFSQYKYEKWGKISEEDLKMAFYPQDSSAKAVILQDHGFINSFFASSKILVTLDMHRRIKIFDETAIDQGNIVIPYLSDRRSMKFSNLDVQVMYPNGDKQKVKSDNIFTQQLTKRWSAKKIFIPNLQKGCIIEYKYTLTSEDFITLYDWYFQHELPVRWSELMVKFPQYFNYTYLLRTPKKFDIQTNETQGGANANEQITFLHYGISHLPALKEEPYMTTLDDHRAHIGFQLNAVIVPFQPVQTYMNTWHDAADKLESLESFGYQYLKQGRYDKLWAAFEAAGHSSVPLAELPEKALRFVSSQIKWNESFGLIPDEDIDQAFEKKTGNSAAVNLAVVALLRKAGLDARPALVSTRDNGEMYPQYPFIDQFNSVLAYVRQGDKGVFIDATDPFHNLNEISTSHQQAMAWVVDSKQPQWVDYTPGEHAETWFGDFKLTADGGLNGVFTLKLTGHRANVWRHELHGKAPAKVLYSYFEDNFPEVAFDSIQLKNIDDYSKALEIKFQLSIREAFPAVNDLIYINPVFYYPFSKNPFKSVKRDFPVSFPWPVHLNYVISFTLPEGYDLEETPAATKLLLPENGGNLIYACSKVNNLDKVQLMMKTTIKQLEFGPAAYPTLRNFFDLLAEKSQSPIVLKKNQ